VWLLGRGRTKEKGKERWDRKVRRETVEGKKPGEETQS